MRSTARLLCILCFALGAALGTVPLIDAATETQPRIESVSPNPVSSGNVGEYIVLQFPTETDLSEWYVTDGTYTADLPNVTVSGRIAVSDHPRVATLLTPTDMYGWEGYLPLAADGDDLTLHGSNGRVVDAISYGETPEGTVWKRNDERSMEPVDAAPVASFDSHQPQHATAFVLPDGAGIVTQELAEADERILIAGYELTDPAIEAILREQHRRGLDVRIVLDGNPVGGQSTVEETILHNLSDAGIPVRVLEAERDRFRFHHPKYAVVDDRAIVMTENWKPAGTGGASSRGWGVVIADPHLTEDLATLFAIDFGGRDSLAWSRREPVEKSVNPNASEPLPISYHPPEDVRVENAELAVAPDHAEARLLDLIHGATERIQVQQVSIGDVSFPLLEALIEAAQRGVEISIHLDDTWYVTEENRALAAELAAYADREDLPLRVEIDDPANRYEKIHTKGLIVDDETVVVGSMNWNNVSMRENREVMVILHGEDVAGYYAEVFTNDWDPPGPRTPVGFLAGVGLLWSGAGLIASRRIAFAAG